MEKQAQIFSQYENLRSEILQFNSLNYQILGLIAASTAGILTIGFTRDDAISRMLIFPTVYAVTFPSYSILQGNRRHIWRITTYIQIFLESQLDYVKWETRLNTLGEMRKSHKYTMLSSLIEMNEWAIVFLLNLVATLATIFFGMLQANIPPNSKIIVILILLALYLIISLKTLRQWKDNRRGGKVEQLYRQIWTQIRDQEENATKD